MHQSGFIVKIRFQTRLRDRFKTGRRKKIGSVKKKKENLNPCAHSATMAFSASPSLTSLASSTAAIAAATPSCSRCPTSNPFPDPKPLHLSVRLFSSALPKLPPLSCSGPHVPRAATGDGSGAGTDSGGNGGKYGGGNDDDNGGGEDYEEAEFGPLLGFNEVLRLAAARGVALPADMMEAAKESGIREVLLLRYFDLQVYRIARIFTEGVKAGCFLTPFNLRRPHLGLSAR